MSAQNIISLGIDTSSFDGSKKQVLNEFIVLFDKLSQYDGKNISPVLGGGLLEFNTSVKETNVLLAELNSKIASLNSSTNQNSSANTAAAAATSSNAKATKTLTQEQADLKVALQEANKSMLDQAKATNASVQARLAEKQAIKDQKEAEKERARQVKQDEKDMAMYAKENARANKELENSRKAATREASEEAKATEKLISDYKLLRQAQQDQATNYSNLFISKGGKANNANANPEVKAALEEYKKTSNVINDIDGQLLKAGKGSQFLGGALNGVWSQLRMLAYILPGLGIAGIFNLAYEAIEKAAISTGLFNDNLKESIDLELEFNKHLSEQRVIFDDIRSQKEKLYQLENKRSFSSQSRRTDVLAAEGNNEVAVLAFRVSDAKVKLAEATNKVNPIGEEEYGYDYAANKLKALIKLQETYENKLKETQLFLDNKNDDTFIKDQLERGKKSGYNQNSLSVQKLLDENGNIVEGKGKQIGGKIYTGTDEQRKSQAELYKSELEISKNTNKQLLDDYKDYIEAISNLDKLKAQEKKLLDDEERKFFVETSKQNIQVKINENSKIISSELSSYQKKVNAMKSNLGLGKALNEKEFYNVEKNLSSTERTTGIARNKKSTDNLNLQNKYNEDIRKLNEDQMQRFLKADTEIQKARLNSSAVADEKIANNTEKSLEDRLKSLSSYFQKRQQMNTIEEQKDIQKATIRAGGRIPQKEKDEIIAKSDEQKANIQADAEKKVYDIVYTSLTKQLNAVKDANQAEDLESDKKYTLELNKLNNSFKNKKISYQDYVQNRKTLDEKYRVNGLESAIVDDKADIDRLQVKLDQFKAMREKSLLNKDNAELNLSASKDNDPNLTKDQNKQKKLDAQKYFDFYTGEVNALDALIVDVDLAQFIKKKKLVADELALAKSKFDQEKRWERDLAQYKDQLVNAGLNLVKTVSDAEYARKIEMLSRERVIVNEQYGLQIGAIEKSSLSAKDKAALDIQLKQQQIEYDKNALQEERKLKRDQAVFDQKIAISKIIWSTAQAVANFIAFPPLMIAAGALGAIQIATVLAAPIPSYAKGTGNHPGGLARYGEAGPELIREPYKSPYLIMDETVSYLPKGTEVIPIKDSPVFGEKNQDYSWEQTKWLARQIRKNNTSVTNKNIINIDLGYQNYKKTILGN